MSDEDLFGSGDEAAPANPMDVEQAGSSSAAAAGSDDENLFGSDDEGGTQWVDAPKTEEEKLAAILGTAPASTESAGPGQAPKVGGVDMTKGKMYLQQTHTLSRDVSKLHFVKTPRFIKIQSKQYDASNFDAEDERTEFGPLTSDVIRWRYKTDDDGNKVLDDSGNPIMESNARLQKLKSGKFQVVIGKSVFDVATEKMQKNYLYMSNLSEPPVDGSGLTDEEVSDGVILNESTNLTMACTLDGATRMTIQPRLDSRAHAHVNQAISKKYRKQDRINVRDVRDILENPEATAEKEEKEERARLLNERKGRDPDRATGYSRRDGRIGMSSDYLNEDQYDEINLSDIKRGVDKDKKKWKKRESRGRLGELEEGDEADEDDEDDEEDSEDQDGDDDDLDGFIVKGGEGEEDEDEDEDDEGESDEDDEPQYFKKGNSKKDKSKKGKGDAEEGGDSDSDLFASDEEPERPAAKRGLDEGEDEAAEEGGAPEKKKVRKGVIAGDSDDE